MTYSVYPQLIGLTFSTVKRPKTSVGLSQAASGRETRISYWTYPMWEWDLTYEYLPDAGGGWESGTTASDVRTIMGFYGQLGQLTPFLFEDPDDFEVTGQSVASGDGAKTSFTLFRSFGAGGFTTTEPVGFVNTGATINVYLAGTLQTSGYSVDTTTPYAQTLNFTSAPGSGVAITIDMQYYYLARFKDSTAEFEKLYNKLWALKKITLMSLKG